VTDCSYGEPPLEKEFEQIVDLLTDTERTFEFTTNGQSLSAKNRAKLLGKTALVHVSIDSASAAGYRRYRDHRFDLIIENLRALCRDKALTGNLPTVSVSFIVMRSNREEIKDFLRLMKDVGVDRVAFRNLYRDEPMSGQTTKHYGFKFDYDKECLSRAELEALGSICLIIGKTIGIPVILEWKDFANNTAAAATNVPLCSEPWKAAYLLNRGIMPCCYGRVPLIKWTELDLSNPEASLREAVNAQAFQELRRDLAAGELGTYCEQCHSCPIVQAHRKAASTASDRVEARFMRD
jgi:MoaA/NifB/PqqE/SkfB family radical SAM enzyme